MTVTINGMTMYVKHIGTFCALLVDEDEREYKMSMKALKNAFPVFRGKRKQNKNNQI
ncbi:hypothetical protein [Dysgonomonas sp.]